MVARCSKNESHVQAVISDVDVTPQVITEKENRTSLLSCSNVQKWDVCSLTTHSSQQRARKRKHVRLGCTRAASARKSRWVESKRIISGIISLQPMQPIFIFIASLPLEILHPVSHHQSFTVRKLPCHLIHAARSLTIVLATDELPPGTRKRPNDSVLGQSPALWIFTPIGFTETCATKSSAQKSPRPKPASTSGSH